jgi:HK97 family phage major capsid protein
MATRDYADLAELRDTTGQPLMKPEVLRDLPFLPSNRLPTNETLGGSTSCSSMIFGYWPDCVVAFRHDFRLEVLRERYADSFQFGFLGHLRVDAQLFHAASFTRLQGISPSTGTT